MESEDEVNLYRIAGMAILTGLTKMNRLNEVKFLSRERAIMVDVYYLNQKNNPNFTIALQKTTNVREIYLF